MVTTLSVYERIDLTTPQVVSLEWEEIALLLSSHDFTHTDRERVPCFSPAELAHGTTRLARNVVRVHFGVADIDKADPAAVQRLIERLKGEGQAFVLYTTWSHYTEVEKGLCRVRVAIPFTRPVEAWEWPAVWSRMNVAFDGLMDPQCKNIDRAYFFPSAPAGSEECAHTELNIGQPWDVDSARTFKVKPPSKPKMVGVKEIQALHKLLKGRRTPYAAWFREKLSALLAGESLAPIGERDDTLWRIACAILDEYPQADARTLAECFAPSIQVMEIEAPECPTVANIEDKIRRHQEKQEEEEADDVAQSDAERKRLIRMAFDFDTGREHPYTRDELEGFAKAMGVTVHDFRAFWLVQKGQSYYVFVGGKYRGPFDAHEVEIAARTYLAPAFSAGVELFYANARTGGELVPKDAKRLMRDYGTLAARVDIDMNAQVSYYDPTRRVLVEAPCPLRPLEAEYSPEVARWLDLLGGEQAPKLKDWLSVVTRIDEPCAALYLEGLNGIGKSLFAEGVARLWSDRGSVALADAFAAFNSNVVECPLIFADEAVPKDFRGQSQTGPLRQMIQARTRTLKRKYLADSNFVGCMRLVLAANNADLIASNEALTVNDIAAIVDRIVHIDATHAHDCKAYVESLGERVKDFVRRDELAKHALWLRENHKADTSHRFLVTGDKSRLHRRLTTSSGLRSGLCNWLVGYLLDPQKVDHTGSLLVRVNSGALLVNVRALAMHWNTYPTNIDPPTTAAIAAALAGLSTGEKVQLTDGRGDRSHYWRMDRDNLVSWANDSGFASADSIDAALKYDTRIKGQKR